MEQFYEEIEEPVSPPGQYFNSSVICSYVYGFLEVAVPIDDDIPTISLLRDVFLPINPRFSSIMVLSLFHMLLNFLQVKQNLIVYTYKVKVIMMFIYNIVCYMRTEFGFKEIYNTHSFQLTELNFFDRPGMI